MGVFDEDQLVDEAVVVDLERKEMEGVLVMIDATSCPKYAGKEWSMRPVFNDPAG